MLRPETCNSSPAALVAAPSSLRVMGSASFQSCLWAAELRSAPACELYFLYQWQSSSKNPADIASCQVGEFVTYKGYVAGQQNYYWWPSPPWQPTKTDNPTKDSVGGTNSYCTQGNLKGVAPCVMNNQQHSSFDTPPTTDNGFPAQQKWWYLCPNVNGGNSVDLTTFTTIQRSVTSSGPTYTYQVTKSGALSSCILGQTCAGP